MLFLGDEPCPKCNSKRIRYSSSLLRHLQRFFTGSRRRLCMDCGERWIGVELKKRMLSRQTVAILIVGGLVAFVAASLATGSFNPVAWFKSQVVGYYDSTYGADSKKKLWEHLGGFYGARSGAEADYGAHKQ